MRPRRILWLVAVLAILPWAAFSFDLAAGVKGGGTLPFYSGSFYRDTILDAAGRQTEFRLGYSAGIFIAIGIVDFLAVQPEALYSVLGGNYGDSSQTWKEKASFLEVPLLLKARLKLGGLRFNPFAGPELLIPIGVWDQEVVDDSTGNVILSAPFDMDEIRDLLIGLVAGVELVIPFGNFSVSVDARYHLGIQSFYTDAIGLDVRQSGVELLMGIGYSLLP